MLDPMPVLPCIGECGRVGPPDPYALFPIYECVPCGEARADAVAASLSGQEIENEAWS